MSLQNFLFRFPSRPEQGLEALRIEGREAERAEIDLVAVLAYLDDRSQLLPIHFGIAVGRHAHDLRGIVGREAEMKTGNLPQKSERMRIRPRLGGFNSRAFAPRQRRTGGLANAVDDEDRGLIIAGGIEGG